MTTEKQRELAPAISWQTWKKRWVAVRDIPTALGLLHHVFSATLPTEDVKELKKESGERIRFLLGLAEGWVQTYEPQDQVRHKAVRVLADHFFKRIDVSHLKNTYDTETVRAVIKFVRTPGNVLWGSGYPAEPIRDFLQSLCKYAWGHQGPLKVYVQSDDDGPYAYVPIFGRQNALEVLHHHDKVMTLIPEPNKGSFAIDRWECTSAWDSFDPEALCKLEVLLVDQFGSVEHGLLKGHGSAQALILARAAYRELEKRKEEQERSRQIAEHESALQKLRSKN